MRKRLRFSIHAHHRYVSVLPQSKQLQAPPTVAAARAGQNGSFQLESSVAQIFRMTLSSLLERGKKITLYTFSEIK